jgi:hypothetical protein
LADQPILLDRALVFGRSAGLWGGGGVCFLDSSPEAAVAASPTFGRAWLLTVEQLEDVWAQENGSVSLESDDVEPVDVDELVASGFVDANHDGWYRRLLFLGQLDGHPMATITSHELPELNPSGTAYLQVVGEGLVETWDLGPADAAAYLASRPGNAGFVDADQLVNQLRT